PVACHELGRMPRRCCGTRPDAATGDAMPGSRDRAWVQSQSVSIEFRIRKHAEVHEAVPSMFLHLGSDFTGSSAIGDFDSEHVFSFSQHGLIPTKKTGRNITEKPVPLLK